ncbi:MAG: hypothetical protein E6G07_03280 [Actinobacteria bacterium]|nr:MAG: hypothetical protein E6G07_03280 [Actinomycetota bacterium]
MATTAVRIVPSYRVRSTSAYTRSKRSSGNWKSVASSYSRSSIARSAATESWAAGSPRSRR